MWQSVADDHWVTTWRQLGDHLRTSSRACLGHHMGYHLGHIWALYGACLGHHLEHVWGIIWGMSGHHPKGKTENLENLTNSHDLAHILSQNFCDKVKGNRRGAGIMHSVISYIEHVIFHIIVHIIWISDN